MHTGQTIKFIKGVGSPLQSKTLAQVAAALTCGSHFSSGKPLLDTVEDDGEGGLKREHTYTFDGEKKVEFKPNFPAEKIDLNELIRRLEDIEWCKANPDHPIAYLRGYIDYRAELVARLKQMKPLEKITRGEDGNRSFVFIPHDATPEERAELMAAFNKA